MAASAAQASWVFAAATRPHGIVRSSQAGVSQLRQGEAAKVLQALVICVTARVQAAGMRAAVDLLQQWSRGALQARRYHLVLEVVESLRRSGVRR